MTILDLTPVISRSPQSAPRPSFVSTQVSEAQRYYLDLAPKRTRGITVVCGGRERVHPEYLVQRRTFPFLAIEFVAEGEGTLDLAGERYRLRPGVAFAYAPEVPHTIRSSAESPMLKYYVDFVGQDAERRLNESPLAKGMAVQVAALGEVTELFEMLQREGSNDSDFCAPICASLLQLLILKIGERALTEGTAEPRALETYQRVRKWIEENYADVRTADEAAKRCHLDAAYLCRLFKRFAHTSPYQFLTRQKMNRAAELLLDHGLMVKQVAAELGFSDPFQFSRSFKRTFGLAPDRFVRLNRT